MEASLFAHGEAETAAWKTETDNAGKRMLLCSLPSYYIKGQK